MKRNHINRPDLPKDFSLESLRDQNPFRVPEGYFDELPGRINDRIEAKPIIKKSRRIHPGIFAAAASMVVLLGLTLVMRTSIFNTSSDVQFSSIPTTHIVDHLDSVIMKGEIDEPVLVDAVVNASALETASNTASSSTKQLQNESTGILPTVSDEAIIEYLVQNTTPTNSTIDLMQ